MPTTERLEDFREFILEPLGYHIEKTDREITRFLSALSKRYENVLGEARRNNEEYNSTGADSSFFFRDMQEKVKFSGKSIFFSDKEGILYTPLKLLISRTGDLEQIYAYHIHDAVLSTLKLFESYTTKNKTNSERFTPIPSFNAISKISAHNAYSELKSNGFIDPDTEINNFVSIFSGEEIFIKIIWTGRISYLVHFIRSLEKNKYINPVGDDIWLVTQKCFSIKGIDNLTVKLLRHAYKTDKTLVLDKIVELFSKSK